MPPSISMPGVYTRQLPFGVRPIASVDTAIAAFVGRALRGPLNKPIRVSSFAEFSQVFGGLWQPSPMSYAIQHFFQQGGSNALVVRVFNGTAGDGEPITDAQVIPVSADAIANREGIYALDSADLFNLLCIPPLAALNDTPPGGAGPSWPDVDSATWASAAAYCLKRRAILLVDPPANWTGSGSTVTQAAGAGAKALRNIIGTAGAGNTAVYLPRLQMPDPMNSNQLAEFAPGGAVAGIIARTDGARGVWKAPAGLDAFFNGVYGFSLNLTSRDNGLLNALGVNCLRSFSGRGNVVWGARTLAGADGVPSEWKYLNVRRLALYLEESLLRGTRWTVDEANGEALWSQLRQAIGVFMESLFRQGAFQGQSTRDAFFVRCDSRTTSQADMNRGIVNVLVGFAPLKPAEFVMLKIGCRALP
jgi:phage tail sheath protein FI